MDKKTLLFDFDGTIAATVEPGVVIFNQLADRYGFGRITPENTDYLRSKGPRAAMKELSIPTLRAPLVLRKLRKGIKHELPNLKPVLTMGSVLTELKRRGYRLGIVTSNSEENVRGFLSKNGIDFFDVIQAGSSLFRKAAAMKKAMNGNQIEKSDVVFVGDEIRDMEAARKNHIHAIAVTWGTNSREGLAETNPDVIIDNPEELLKMFS
jgi:phosphoglycolate phosphatase